MSNVLIELEIKKWQDESTSKYHLSATVIRYENIQAEIFVYKRDLVDETDMFSNIASPTQLVSLPRHHHQTGNIFYLENSVELEFDTAKKREDTESFLVNDVRQLKEDWEIVKDQMDVAYNVII